MTLPASERSVAAYMIVIGQRVTAAEVLLANDDLSGALDLVREVESLAREGLATLGATPGELAQFGPQSLSDYLIDIESAVLRYKAHRPGLRSADAAPKILNHLLEIVSAASACLAQHRGRRS